MRDVVPELSALLDGFTATGGGRTQRFSFLPWGRHLSAQRQAALPAQAGLETAPRGVVTIRPVSNPQIVTDIGGGAERNRQTVDVHVLWADGPDVAEGNGPLLWRRAVSYAVAAAVHANEKNVGQAWFTRITNEIDGTQLLQDGGTGTLQHELIVTVEAVADEVYG